MNKKKMFLLSMIFIALFLVVSVKSSTSYIDKVISNIDSNGCLTIMYDEKDTIEFNYNNKKSDIHALEEEPYTFKIKNTCRNKVSYTLRIESLKGSTIPEENIKIEYNKGNIEVLNTKYTSNPIIEDSKGAFLLETGELGAGETQSKTVRVWLSYSARTALRDMKYIGKITIS